MRVSRLLFAFPLVALTPTRPAPITPRPTEVPLGALDIAKMRVQAMTGRGANQANNVARADRSVDQNPIRIGDREFSHGVGTRASSVLFINLAGGADRFTALVGADNNPPPPPPAAAPGANPPAAPPPPPPIVFRVLGDGRILHVSRPLARGEAPESLSVDVRGIQTLVLQVKPVEGTRPVAANWA